MPSYTLKRFARMQTLKSIKPSALHVFLQPYGNYFAARGFDIELITEHMFPDYCKDLVSILGYPDADTPQRLIDALYHVDGMSTPSGMEVLLKEYGDAGYRFDDPEPTPVDIAVHAWIMDSSLFEKIYAKQQQFAWKRFRVHVPEDSVNIESMFNASGLTELENELNDWSETNKLGRHCKIFELPGIGERCFIIRRGQPYSRVSAITKGRSSSIVFQPETFDIVICNFKGNELHISARSKGIRDIYRRLIGRHLFANEDFFSTRPVYTLYPIASKGKEALYCNDIPGMVDVKVKKLEVKISGLDKSLVFKAPDVCSTPEFMQQLSADSNIKMAEFLIKFDDNCRPRCVEIIPPNVLRYRREGDMYPLGQLLKSRGFVIRENYGGMNNGRPV
ncbi:MAG: hypothetical protein ACYC27_19545 [Armatimonadota bacterium]